MLKFYLTLTVYFAAIFTLHGVEFWNSQELSRLNDRLYVTSCDYFDDNVAEIISDMLWKIDRAFPDLSTQDRNRIVGACEDIVEIVCLDQIDSNGLDEIADAIRRLEKSKFFEFNGNPALYRAGAYKEVERLRKFLGI